MDDFFKTLNVNQSLTILDVGSLRVGWNDKTYRDLLLSCNWKYTGLDLSTGNNVDIVSSDLYHYPLDDNSFDIVISGQTLEHVAWPWEWIKELYRVLKPGGIVYIIAPSEGPIHYRPDCWRIKPDGMEALLKYAGFKDIETDVDLTNSKWRDCWGKAIKNNI